MLSDPEIIESFNTQLLEKETFFALNNIPEEYIAPPFKARHASNLESSMVVVFSILPKT